VFRDLAGRRTLHLGLYLGQAGYLVIDSFGLPRVSRIGRLDGNVLDPDAVMPEGNCVSSLVMRVRRVMNRGTVVQLGS
jgi:hypothetical protein